VVLVFFLVELFDATGTLMGVASRAGLLVEGKMERLNKALLADSGAIVAGAVLGTSSTTAYIESAAGRAGRRPHRPDRADGGRAVPGLPVHRAAGRRGAGLCDRAGAAVRRLPDAARPRRHRMERHHRSVPAAITRW
jgi:hypothetical protein